MGTMFHAIPIPAYDIDDQLILLAQYWQKLSGALAEIDFHLSHTNFNTKDFFTANLSCIHVFQDPPTFPSFQKWRLSQTFLDSHV